MHPIPQRVALRRAVKALAITAPMIISPFSAFAATDSEVAELKTLLQQLRTDYETRIQTLETRLAAAEQQVTAQPVAAVPPVQADDTSTIARDNNFNPGIGVVLNGALRSFSDQVGGDVAGFPGGAESGRASSGFSLAESEISMATSIDDRFDGKLTFSLVDEDGTTGVELEEAWIETAISDGASLRAGRFLSGIGYLNGKHAHTDDFADRSLPYRLMLNGRYADDGLRLSGGAPTETFVELGAEYMRGQQYPAAGSGDRGKGAYTAFLKLGDDFGISNSWTAGLSYLDASASGRLSGTAGAEDSFTGDSDLWIADAVWKWAPNGNASSQNLTLQGEYFWREENGEFTPNGGAATAYNGKQQGWYAQATYQFMPQWRVGLRTSALEADNPGTALAGTALDPQGHDPREVSVMLDWSNSEFSQVRLQYTRDESRVLADDQWTLQYITSFGAHGSHGY